MKIHILGICGTFMGGIALLAKAQGYEVSGSDENVYPPMSTMLANAGIEIWQGYSEKHLMPAPDCVVIGNTCQRGNAAVEHVLNQDLRYTSGPQWLAENILLGRHVLAGAGTHGKTTTATMLAWILDYAQLNPGFLIGGVPLGFEGSARLGDEKYFVVEADEYDSAFFDKRSKFIHYRPRTLVLNNLEYDHADIFPDMAALKQQFHYLIRTLPSHGTIIYHANEPELASVLKQGCWSNTQMIGEGGPWQAKNIQAAGSQFEIWHHDKKIGELNWSLIGMHNVKNALSAIAAAADIHVPVATSIDALTQFPGVKRRLEIRGVINDITVYDDFAHHPTAIKTTLQGLRAKVGTQNIIAVVQFGSYTMRRGIHRDTMASVLNEADQVVLLKPDEDFGVNVIAQQLQSRVSVHENVNGILQQLISTLKPQDHVVIMSNKNFDNIHERLLSALKSTALNSTVIK